MHNSLLPEVVEMLRLLNDGEVICLRDKFYLEVPKDEFSQHRKCIVILEKTNGKWYISETENYQFYESN